jgi:hypothetical protein
VSKGSITLNQSSDETIELDAGGGGGSYTAGTGIDITNDVISVTSPTLTNTATGTGCLAILGSISASYLTNSTVIGYGASSNVSSATVLGNSASVTSAGGVALGRNAVVSGSYGIQLGYGTNSEANSFYVGTDTNNNWKLLGSDGKIPDARLNTPIPPQTGNSGKFLTTDGSAVSWATVSSGSSYTAGTGIDITNNTISVTSPTLTNTATGANALTILSTNICTSNGGINIGSGSDAYAFGVSFGLNSYADTQGTSIGYNSKARGKNSIAVGGTAQISSNTNYAIQLGYGTNSESNSFYVGTSTSNNWKMLGSDGKIPDGRLPIATSVSSSSTNADVVGAKLFYDTCGDIETLINAL